MIEFSLTGSVEVIYEILIHNNRLIVNIALDKIIENKKCMCRINIRLTKSWILSIECTHSFKKKKFDIKWWEIIRTEYIWNRHDTCQRWSKECPTKNSCFFLSWNFNNNNNNKNTKFEIYYFFYCSLFSFGKCWFKFIDLINNFIE
jgi:hypothetical protein